MSAKPPKVGADDYIQRGRGKEDLEALRREALGLVVERDGERYVVRWAQHKVEAIFTGLHDNARGIEAICSLFHDGERVHWGSLTLSSTSKRAEIIRALKELNAHGPAWRYIVEQTCYLVAEAFTAPEPAVLLQARRRPAGMQQAVAPPIQASGATILFGHGGKGKGWVGLLTAMVLRLGTRLAGLQPNLAKLGKVLYLDYESDRESFEHRLAILGDGLGVGLANLIHYRRMVRPVADSLAVLQQDMATIQPVAIVLDSLTPGSGREPEGADAATRTLNALRSLGLPALVIAHVSAASAITSGPARPFGSVFNWNLARAAWEIQSEYLVTADGATLTMGLYNRKPPSEGYAPAPFGLRLSFTPAKEATRVDVAPFNPLTTDNEVFVQKLESVEDRVLALLRSGDKTTEEIKDAAGIKSLDAAQKNLRRYLKQGKVVKVSDGGGRGKLATWGLATSREPEP